MGLSLTPLEWLMCDRSPPLQTERIVGLVARRGASDEAVAELAFALPPEPHGRPASEHQRCRFVRAGMMSAAAVAILIVVAVVLSVTASG